MTILTKNMFIVRVDRVIGDPVLILTLAAARKMEATIITVIIILRVIFGERTSVFSVSVAKNRCAFSVRYQRLARGADCYAAAIATSGIAANVRVVYK